MLAKLAGCRPPYLPQRPIFWRAIALRGRLCWGLAGVASGWQAYAKILVGADLVQLYRASAQRAGIASANLARTGHFDAGRWG